MKRLKIVLIEPINPQPFVIRKLTMPRTGLAGLAAILKSHGHQTIVYAEQVSKINWGEVLEADLIGIGPLTSSFNRACKIAQWIKERKNIPIVMGGPHFLDISEAKVALKKGVDFVIHHDGEPVILPLLEAIKSGGDFGKIHNLSWKTKEGEIIHNSISPTLYDLNDYPIHDLESVRGWKENQKRIFKPPIPIETSRGCPYNCAFCCIWRQYGRKIRYREPESVVEYINYLLKKGYNGFFFVDDNFAINPQRTARLCELLAKLNPLPHFAAQISVNTDPSLFPLIKRAGGTRMFIGAESLSSTTLREYKKYHNMEKVENGEEKLRKCVLELKEAGLKIHLMWMAGADSDDPEVIRKNINFSIEVGADTLWKAITTPYKGTELYQTLDREKRIFDKNLNKYNGTHCVFYPRHFTPRELEWQVIKEQSRFYTLWRAVSDRFLKKQGGNFWPRIAGWFTLKLLTLRYLLRKA